MKTSFSNKNWPGICGVSDIGKEYLLDPQIAKEFEPELGRIYVERISGQDNDRKKIERVRVNNSDSKYPEGKNRDVYGSKLQIKKTCKSKRK